MTSSEAMDLPDVVCVGIVLAMPPIVGAKVRINSLVTIVAVLVGGALCGYPGMFLSIPLLAVLKVIFDRVDGLKPLGMLLGDDVRVSGARQSSVKL